MLKRMCKSCVIQCITTYQNNNNNNNFKLLFQSWTPRTNLLQFSFNSLRYGKSTSKIQRQVCTCQDCLMINAVPQTLTVNKLFNYKFSVIINLCLHDGNLIVTPWSTRTKNSCTPIINQTVELLLSIKSNKKSNFRNMKSTLCRVVSQSVNFLLHWLAKPNTLVTCHYGTR